MLRSKEWIHLTAPKVKANRFSVEDTGGLGEGYGNRFLLTTIRNIEIRSGKLTDFGPPKLADSLRFLAKTISPNPKDASLNLPNPISQNPKYGQAQKACDIHRPGGLSGP
jgi:hypothetical protein